MSGNHSNHFDSAEEISTNAKAWLIGAGLFAAALTAFIINADYRLSHSTHERELGETLFEMRTAQASMKSHVTDPRQTEEFLKPRNERGTTLSNSTAGVPPVTAVK